MDTAALIDAVTSALAGAADPAKAGPMAAYMKTDTPFYGVQKSGRTTVLRGIKQKFVPASQGEYEDAVLALWCLSHREEKYIAVAYARLFNDFVGPASMPLYRRLVVEGAWWDFVDEIASHLIGGVLMAYRPEVASEVRSWILDEDMWLRRTSIISQLRHKGETDTKLLDDACTRNLADTEFFIRKAIGWALREYAKTDAEWVRVYTGDHQDEMSALSYREATKHL